MKTLAFISIIGSVLLSGCAHYGYQHSYADYGGGYSSGYGMQSYSYPSSGYYRERSVPAQPRGYSSPRYDHDRDGRHHDWQVPHHDRYDDMRNMERRLDRQQHAIHQGIRSGDLTRREAKRLQQDTQSMERRLDRIQRRPIASQMHSDQLEHDLNRSQERIRQFKTNDLTRGNRRHDDGGGRDGHDSRNRNH